MGVSIMNILFVSNYFWEKDKMNFGPYPLIYNIVERIAKTENVTVLAGGWPKYSKTQDIGNIRVVRTFSPSIKPLSLEYFFLGTSGLKSVLREKPDIVNSQDVDGASLFWYLNKLKVSVPRVLSFKGLWGGWLDKIPIDDKYLEFRVKTNLLFPKMWENVCLRNSDRIIVPSKYVEDETSRIYEIEKAKISVINNGVDLGVFKPMDDCDHPLTILFMGGISIRKGADVAIEVYVKLKKKFPSLRLLVAGTKTMGRFSNVFDKEGIVIGKDVILLGVVPYADMPRVYNSCDVLFHPSYFETFGSVIAEAMACGKPVVVTNDTGMPEVAGDCGYLVAPGDVDGFVGAIFKLLDDSRLRRKIGQRARRRAEAFFSIDRVVKDYLKFFRALV